MSPEKLLLYELMDAISKMPNDTQVDIEVRAMTLRNMLKDDPHGLMALALVVVGAEMAAKDD